VTGFLAGMCTCAVLHQFGAWLHAREFQVVWVQGKMALSCAFVATWNLVITPRWTIGIATLHNSNVFASRKSFFNLHCTFHSGRICATFDKRIVSTVELLVYYLLAIITALDKARQFARMEASQTKSFTMLLTLDIRVSLHHEVANIGAPVTTVESIVTNQSAAPSWRVRHRISRVLKVKGLGWMNFAPAVICFNYN
jgi:hypothetical protein